MVGEKGLRLSTALCFCVQCEELNSELDLRLHLHQPRSRRAELDVHNVRAGKAGLVFQ